MIFEQTNYLAIVLAAVIAMFIGGIWYSPLVAGKAWMKEVGLGEDDLRDPKPAMIKTFLAMLVLAWGLNWVIKATGTTGAWDSAQLGALLGIVIHGAASLPNYAFEDRSAMHFAIHLGNSVIAMAAMGAVLGFWP